MRTKTELATLLDELELSTSKAAKLLGKHPCTLRQWRAGIHPTPPWAIELLRAKADAPPNLFGQHPDLVEYLSDNLRGGALHYILAGHQPALAAWLDSIDDHGRLEIPPRDSVTRAPLLSNWPLYAKPG